VDECKPLGVGDSVMKLTLRSLQTVFLKGLGTDYAKWSSDADYRKMREEAANLKK
jgi:hypothetical protein